MTDFSVRSYRFGLLGSYLLGVALLLVQPLRLVFSGAFTGVLPYRGIDESLYLIRLQEGLLSPLANTRGGIWSTPTNPLAIQMAGMERVAGWLFGWTGWDATVVALIISVILAPLSLILVSEFARRNGVPRWASILTAIAFFFAVGFLRRFFNPSWSMPILLCTFLALDAWWHHPSRWNALLAGVLLGILPGIYFWAWTFGWAAFGVLIVYMFIQHGPLRLPRIKTGILCGVTALIVASPMLYAIVTVQLDPLFPEVSARMGLLHSRELESPIRSILFLLLAGSVLWAFRSYKAREHHAPFIALAVTPFIVMHQQFVHGRIISFSSHYYMYATLAATLAAAMFLFRGKSFVAKLVGIAASLVIIGAAVHDYGPRLPLLSPPHPFLTSFSHLAPAFDLLNSRPRDVLLTDNETANLTASMTDDDVVFTDYARILLIPTQEYIERFCLSEAFGTKTPEELATYDADFQKEQSRAGREQTDALYRKHYDMTLATCPLVRADPAAYLEKFAVSGVLWNEALRPDWKLPSALFAKQSSGSGWSLWELRR